MKFYFAPMEGITGYPFRNAFQQYFTGIDRYYTPFLSANDTFSFTTRELRDTDPALNHVPELVPQIITNNSEMFVWAIGEMVKLGYTEINLNAGCPSGTVVAKNKGAGMLRYPDKLDSFLEETFDQLDRQNIKCSISVKTRIGIHDPSESEELITIYNRYPINDLIIHSRVQKEFYRGDVHYDIFRNFIDNSRAHLVYNGDIRTKDDYDKITQLFPEIDTVMIGRGLLMNPALVREINGGGPLTLDEVKSFHDSLLENYIPEMGSDKNVLFKVKEYWGWLSKSFTDSDRYMKEIRKAKNLSEYRSAVRNLMANCKLECHDYRIS